MTAYRVRWYRFLYDGTERIQDTFFRNHGRAKAYAALCLEQAKPGEQIDVDTVPFPDDGEDGVSVHY